MRVVLLSCAGAPFSAEVMDSATSLRAQFAKDIVAVVLSQPRPRRKAVDSAKLGALREGFIRRIRVGIEWRANAVKTEAGLRWRAAMRLAGLRQPHRRIEDFCATNGLDVIHTQDINSVESLDKLRALAPDVIVIATFHYILKRPAIETARLAAINIHPSYLPELRGPDPIGDALRNRYEQTGVTLHLVDEGIDTGNIIYQERLVIEPGASEDSLRRQLATLAGVLLCRCLAQL